MNVIVIFPDEAAVVPGFRECMIRAEFPVMIYRIQVEQEQSSRIEIVIHQTEDLQQVPVIRDVIQGIADGYDRADRSVQFK